MLKNSFFFLICCEQLTYYETFFITFYFLISGWCNLMALKEISSLDMTYYPGPRKKKSTLITPKMWGCTWKRKIGVKKVGENYLCGRRFISCCKQPWLGIAILVAYYNVLSRRLEKSVQDLNFRLGIYVFGISTVNFRIWRSLNIT